MGNLAKAGDTSGPVGPSGFWDTLILRRLQARFPEPHLFAAAIFVNPPEVPDGLFLNSNPDATPDFLPATQAPPGFATYTVRTA